AQVDSLLHALVRLPVAALLSATLAFRPRRRGTPKRQAPVIQTQIVLALVGAMVMMVVGASLARAFGIVGAAGLIRYRAKIDDPKDAGVMLSTLALGLASGVGLYLLALFAMTFVLVVLWILESIEPEPYTTFDLTVHLAGSSVGVSGAWSPGSSSSSSGSKKLPPPSSTAPMARMFSRRGLRCKFIAQPPAIARMRSPGNEQDGRHALPLAFAR